MAVKLCDNFYKNLSNDLLGCFYYYIKKKFDHGEDLFAMKKEIKVIKEVAMKRKVSLRELYIRGFWISQMELNLTKPE